MPPQFVRFSPTICHYPFILLGGERHCVLPKNTTQCPRPGLKPRLLALGMSTLTMRPPHLHFFSPHPRWVKIHVLLVASIYSNDVVTLSKIPQNLTDRRRKRKDIDIHVNLSQVNYHSDSHRTLINTNLCFKYKKLRDCEEKEIFSCRFIVQSLGLLNSLWTQIRIWVEGI